MGYVYVKDSEGYVFKKLEAELLRGSKSANDFAQIQTHLTDFYYLNFVENDWVSLAKQFIALKKNRRVVRCKML